MCVCVMTRVYVFMFICWRVFVGGVCACMFYVGRVCGCVFLCVFEHLFACVCIRVFELRELAREFGLYVL